jgi:hypothetical protein
VGIGGIVYGAIALVRESLLSLQVLRDHSDYVRDAAEELERSSAAKDDAA